MLRASSSHGFPPLNFHCLCLRISDDVHGKTVVELKNASPNRFASLFGYAERGTLHACYTMHRLEQRNGILHYDGKSLDQFALRRSRDDSYR